MKKIEFEWVSIRDRLPDVSGEHSTRTSDALILLGDWPGAVRTGFMSRCGETALFHANGASWNASDGSVTHWAYMSLLVPDGGDVDWISPIDRAPMPGQAVYFLFSGDRLSGDGGTWIDGFWAESRDGCFMAFKADRGFEYMAKEVDAWKPREVMK